MLGGSLFDGIAGFPLAGQRVGIKFVWASEIEPFPISVSKRHFPDMKHLGDITKINGAEIEPVDVITFGSPCQDLSVAGERAGMGYKCLDCEHIWDYSTTYGIDSACPNCGSENIELTRSGLFVEATRIIREMRDVTNGLYPRFIVWENVPGAFSSNGGHDFQAVLSEISESEVPMPGSGGWAPAGMVRGGTVEIAWRILDAQYWGVPQRRKRIFLVADFRGQCAGEILFKSESLSGYSTESTTTREGIAGSVAVGVGESGNVAHCLRAGASKADKHESTTYIVDPSYGADLSQKAEGVGFTKEKSACLAPGTHGGWGMNVIHPQIARALTARNDGSPCIDRGPDAVLCAAFKQGNSATAGGIGYEEEKSPTLTAGQSGTNLVPVVVHPEVTGTLCASGAGMSRPAGMVNETDLVVAFDHSRCPKPSLELSPTLKACNNPNSSPNGLNSPAILTNYRVRRLTPTECERLQGFPDGYTAGGSDTSRYKSLGNSVAMPCVEYIMAGIAECLRGR